MKYLIIILSLFILSCTARARYMCPPENQRNAAGFFIACGREHPRQYCEKLMKTIYFKPEWTDEEAPEL